MCVIHTQTHTHKAGLEVAHASDTGPALAYVLYIYRRILLGVRVKVVARIASDVVVVVVLLRLWQPLTTQPGHTHQPPSEKHSARCAHHDGAPGRRGDTHSI